MEPSFAETKLEVMEYIDCTKLPSGSLIVTRNSSDVVIYFCNDLHIHTHILLWINPDTGEVKLGYEKGVTQLFMLGMFIDHHGADFCYVSLVKPDIHIFADDLALIPKDQILGHSQYTEILSRITKFFPILFLRNDCQYMFAYKYIPNLLDHPNSFYGEPRKLYRELEKSSDPMKVFIERYMKTKLSCVDISCLFLSIMYEDLFGEQILMDTSHEIVTSILSNEELYKIYKPDLHRCAKVHVPFFRFVFIYLFPFILALLLYLLLYFFALPIVHVLLRRSPVRL